MKTTIILLVSVLFAFRLFAYPITPRPLRKLISESEFIIWGKVLELGTVKQTKKNADIWERDFATIVVQEKLQGKLKADTVKVYFCSGMICPAPGTFEEGEQVLVFLDKREKQNGFVVHALSYGVKHGMNDQDYQFYKARIVEMQALIAKDTELNCSPQLIDWLLKCAEQKHTRWDGLYELSPQSDFMSYYDRGELACKETYLTIDRRKKLFEILLSIDTLGYEDFALADITTGINDSLLLEFLKSRLLRADDAYYWCANEIIKRIALLADTDELTTLANQFDKVYYSYKDEDKEAAKNLLKDFIMKMKNARLKITKGVMGNYNTLLFTTAYPVKVS